MLFEGDSDTGEGGSPLGKWRRAPVVPDALPPSASLPPRSRGGSVRSNRHFSGAAAAAVAAEAEVVGASRGRRGDGKGSGGERLKSGGITPPMAGRARAGAGRAARAGGERREQGDSCESREKDASRRGQGSFLPDFARMCAHKGRIPNFLKGEARPT